VTDEKPRRTAAPKAAAPKAAAPKAAATKTAAPKAPAAKTAAPKAAAPRVPRRKDAAPAAAPANLAATTQVETPAVAGGLRRRYHDEVAPALRREFGYANLMQTPRLEKVVVNIGLGEAIQNAKALDAAVGDLTRITGQKPIVTKAKRSIAQFRLRTGMPIGAKVTLRGQRMYDFLERTMRLALPRIRDFRGISRSSFDGRGNFSLGLREQLVYPEIDYDKIDRLRGMEISIVTTAKTDEEGLKLLQLLGMPFQAS
jgi:large subunit ribosomal protein L5